jgi:thymidylate synthase
MILKTVDMKNNFELKYQKLLKKCLINGIERKDRTNVGCYSIFNLSLKFKVNKYFPIITGRKMFKKTFNTEFNWFINGETNIKRFKENNVKIWDSWANEFGELGPVYGFQMLNYNGQNINQLQTVIKSIKENPDSRRHIISLWNPIQLNEMALPPCYLYFQFFVQKNKLNMFVLQRSGDMFLGIPYDVALFTMILLYVSNQCNLKANKVEFNIIDAHVYKNQIEAINEYLLQPIYDLPKYKFENNNIELIDYRHGKTITSQIAI